uniref:Retrotransposon gag domain-containing protein n=1 Tax=Cannabis sativa TaxID=3483 RepID=A0A803NHZ4_CANSA
MAGNQTTGDNNASSINIRTMNVQLPGNGTTPVDTINGGVGRTTITLLNLFPEIAIHVGETSTPTATVGKNLPITPVVGTQDRTGRAQLKSANAERSSRTKLQSRSTARGGPKQRNPHSKAQPRNEVNDAESCSSSSQSCTPSVYTRSSSVETSREGRYQVHTGDLCDHHNVVFRVRSQTPQNREEPRDPQLGDQGINNGNNPVDITSPPNAPTVTTGVVILANIATVATAPNTTQNNAILLGGVDQSILLQALKIIEQQRMPIYKLHGTSPFTKKLPEASMSTWETFVDLFLTHFQATMRYRPPYTTLANIKQEVSESLQDYFKRFNAEVTKVEKVSESSLVCMLITGDSKKSQERYAKEAKEKPLTDVNNLSERPKKLFKKECDDITFMESDARWVHHPHAGALVIVANIGGHNVHRILVDNGSLVNLLKFQAFKQMGLQEKDLSPVVSRIYGFTGDKIALKGMIKLPITLGTAPVTAKSMANFAVIDQYSAYNVVIGRPILKKMKIVTSIYNLTMKFPTLAGVGSMR